MYTFRKKPGRDNKFTKSYKQDCCSNITEELVLTKLGRVISHFHFVYVDDIYIRYLTFGGSE